MFISKVVVQLRRVSANSSTSSPALGSRIDLQRVQTLMEAMGSKLSPGAQQLMNMVKFQQQAGRHRFCPGTIKNFQVMAFHKDMY